MTGVLMHGVSNGEEERREEKERNESENGLCANLGIGFQQGRRRTVFVR